MTPAAADSGKQSSAPKAESTCSDCKHFDAYDGWCSLHNSAQWPDQPACRLVVHLAALFASIPVPADARERTWTKIAAALTEGVSAPQPAVGNSGSTGLAASFRGVTVTSPSQGATHSGALAAVGEGR